MILAAAPGKAPQANIAIPVLNLSVTCPSRLNINATHVFIEHALDTLRSWRADYRSAARAAPFSPYFIVNKTGGAHFPETGSIDRLSGPVSYTCRTLYTSKRLVVAAQ